MRPPIFARASFATNSYISIDEANDGGVTVTVRGENEPYPSCVDVSRADLTAMSANLTSYLTRTAKG